MGSVPRWRHEHAGAAVAGGAASAEEQGHRVRGFCLAAHRTGQDNHATRWLGHSHQSSGARAAVPSCFQSKKLLLVDTADVEKARPGEETTTAADRKHDATPSIATTQGRSRRGTGGPKNSFLIIQARRTDILTLF